MDFQKAKRLIRNGETEAVEKYLCDLEVFSRSDFKKLMSQTDDENMQKAIRKMYKVKGPADDREELDLTDNTDNATHSSNDTSLEETKGPQDLVENKANLDTQKETEKGSNCIPCEKTEVFESITFEAALEKYMQSKSSLENKAIKMFMEAFASNLSEINNDKVGLLSQQITLEIFKNKKEETPKLIRTKILNLKDKNNPALCRNVYEGIISPTRFVEMSTEEMKSQNLKQTEEKMLQDSYYDAQIPEIRAETDIFKCSKCGQRKCSYRQLQTRSADEPMTTFVACVCGHRWRFC